jgi:hypothetical protein
MKPMIIEASKISDRIILPSTPNTSVESLEMAVYVRFMRRVAEVPNSRLEIKILHALQFTADMTGLEVIEVAATLVDCGLRAPRLAFPACFLAVADAALLRDRGTIGAAGSSLTDLKHHWGGLGEDIWAAALQPQPLRVPQTLFV